MFGWERIECSALCPLEYLDRKFVCLRGQWARDNPSERMDERGA